MFDFCPTKTYTIFDPTNRKGKMAVKGRPTNNPKNAKMSVRLTLTDKEFLISYSKKENISLTETFSRAIELLKGQKK